MAKVKSEYTAKISQNLACIIEYGYSDDEEFETEEAVREWVADFNAEGHAVFSYGEETFFGTCDICHLGATCVDVTITIFEQE